MKEIEVVAAIIKHKDKILCVQRGEGKYDYISKKFEFPGGKVEEGETEEQALTREIQEELAMKIMPQSAFITVNHNYPDFSITMKSFFCQCNDPEVKLNEHLDFKWLHLSEMKSLDWAEADIPIVDKLIELG